MIQLTEDDVGGAFSGRPEDDARRLARRRALDALAQPIDLGAIGREGEAAQAIVDARSAVEDPRHFAGDVGLRPEDAIPPPAQSGPLDMPAAPAGRRVVLTEQDVPPVTASLSQPSSGDVRRTLSPQALTHRDAHQAADVTTPTPASPAASGKNGERPASARDQEIAAIRRASLARALGSMAEDAVRLVGMGLTKAPVTRTSAVPDPGAGPEQEAAAIARHNALAAEKTREGREAELAAARLEREQAASADEMAFRREQLDVMRQRAERGPATSPLQQAQADRIREEIERHQREMRPDSPESATARAQYLALVDTLPQGMRGRLMQAIPPERVETMSAAELRAPTARIQAFRERGTAGTGGPPSSVTVERRQGLMDAAIAAGIDPDVAASMDREALARMVAAAGIGTSQERQQRARREILPGVHATVAVSQGEAQEIRRSFSQAGSAIANLTNLEGIAEEGGAGGVFSPAQRASVTPRLTVGRGMVAQLGNTGIINPSEVPAINAALPNPNELEQMTLGTFSQRVRAWRGLLEDNVRASLSTRGVDDAGVARAIQILRTGRIPRAATRPDGRAAPEAEPERVRMIDPQGRPVRVRADQRDVALRQGYREVAGGP